MAFQTPNLLLSQISERPQVPGNPVRERSTSSSECHFAAIRDVTPLVFSQCIAASPQQWGEERKVLD